MHEANYRGSSHSSLQTTMRYAHPDDYTESIYSTAANGYIVIKTDGQNIDIETFDFEELEE